MGVIVVKLPSDQMLDHLDKVVARLVKSILPKLVPRWYLGGVLAPTSKYSILSEIPVAGKAR
jgi:hypothetical protein